jgi:integrase
VGRKSIHGGVIALGGDRIGNYDEFRFFTGLRPSEQIALLVTDYDARSTVLSVTKTQEDRDIELCPRALEVLRRHLALRAEYVAAGKIRHEHPFFLEDGRADQRPRDHPLALEREH